MGKRAEQKQKRLEKVEFYSIIIRGAFGSFYERHEEEYLDKTKLVFKTIEAVGCAVKSLKEEHPEDLDYIKQSSSVVLSEIKGLFTCELHKKEREEWITCQFFPELNKRNKKASN